MPLILEFEFDDGKRAEERIPAEIWRIITKEISKIFAFEKILKQVVFDPHWELIDANYNNNTQFAPSSYEKIELITQINPHLILCKS